MRRPITTFRNRHCTVTHDPVRGGAVHPDTNERIVGLDEFFRALQAQRRAHRELGEPYAITQEIVAGDAGAEERTE
ncbi:hypothetical protein [Caldovatus aquaticus]|uniref:Uncharacterized protein n=1 Tax=Caldovatus aquaticus TaxID=2865671 RepID=A0ABS7EY63_9PROT|nr:hypothetical protein [Caldovatus aquaticus]MBW8268302.1 hypothetical protein [Caldovatus aquaticus]